MTLILWAAIGVAVGNLVAGRPIVIFYLFGLVTIDVRPLWRVIGAVSAIGGGLAGNQLFGSSQIQPPFDLPAAWTRLSSLVAAHGIEVPPILAAITAVLLARAAVRVFEREERTAGPNPPAGRDTLERRV
jgi:hypothetical protein